MSVEKVDPGQAAQHMKESHALLVCAYDDHEKFQSNKLQGAMSLSSLEQQTQSISKDRELIFY